MAGETKLRGGSTGRSDSSIPRGFWAGSSRGRILEWGEAVWTRFLDASNPTSTGWLVRGAAQCLLERARTAM